MWRNRGPGVDSNRYTLNVTYQNWGLYQPGGSPEPNNVTGSEFCAVANASQPARNVWGWSDTKCDNNLVHLHVLLPT
jgi:hypothetical protein